MISKKKIRTMQGAQALVRSFAKRNGWEDEPNIDKFDHLHEELIEMSQYLRYKSASERKRLVKKDHAVFVDGVGDLFFGLCRLANQLGVDIEDAFHRAASEILQKYNRESSESNRAK